MEEKKQSKLFEFFNKFREKDYIVIKERGKSGKEYEVNTELPAGIAFYIADNIEEIREVLTEIQETFKKEKEVTEKKAVKIVKKSALGKGLDFIFNLLSEILMVDYDFMTPEWCKKQLGLKYAIELMFTFAADVAETFSALGGSDLIGQVVGKDQAEA